MKFKYEKYQHEVWPPFYYGFAYIDMMRVTVVFYVWPLNLAVKLWRAFRDIQGEKWRYLTDRAWEEAERKQKEVTDGMIVD